MKRAIIVSAVLVFLAASSYGITQGPSGRLYFQQNEIGSGGSYYNHLYSMQIAADWSFVEWVDHGQILDNNSNIGYREKVTSPEVQVYGGTGYGTIVEGLFFNGTPASNLPGTIFGTMDVVAITPNAGGYTTSLRGDGKASISGSTWTDSRPVGGVGNTEYGHMAVPDPEGGFAGAGNIAFEREDWNRATYVLTDSQSDGDVTDDLADYVDGRAPGDGGSSLIHDSDYEILGNRWYKSSGYGITSNADGVWYQVHTAGSATQISDYVPFAYQGGGSVTQDIDDDPDFAVGIVQGHHAVWMEASGQLYMYIDLNDDGNAMGQGEQILAFHDDDSGQRVDNPGGWQDLELVRNEQGTMFLIGVNINANWKVGKSICIIELADNGVYAGGDGVRTITEISEAGQTIFTMGGSPAEIEFDSQALVAQEPIPEPATLLLLGTGALGAIGYVRRRRMN